MRSHGVSVISNPCGPTYMGSACGTRWLNMSRAFGDFVYPAVLCEPFVCSLDIRDARYLVREGGGRVEAATCMPASSTAPSALFGPAAALRVLRAASAKQRSLCCAPGCLYRGAHRLCGTGMP